MDDDLGEGKTKGCKANNQQALPVPHRKYYRIIVNFTAMCFHP